MDAGRIQRLVGMRKFGDDGGGRPIIPEMNAFNHHRCHKALSFGVFVRIASPSHLAPQTVSGHKIAT